MATKIKPGVARGTVVKLRDSNGRATGKKGIVMSNVAASSFSRAYGRQVHVCLIYGRKVNSALIAEKGAGDLIPVGKVKKIPAKCREQLKTYKAIR